MKDGERINQRHLCATHGHKEQYGDWLGEGREWGWVEVGKGRKNGNNCNSINNKNKKLKKCIKETAKLSFSRALEISLSSVCLKYTKKFFKYTKIKKLKHKF